jgi:hypothetical protein
MYASRSSVIAVGLAALGLGALGACQGQAAWASQPAEVTEAPDAWTDAAPDDAMIDEAGELPDDAPAPNACPLAVIQLDEDTQVIPQTLLHLHGGRSHSAVGEIVAYQWTVDAVAGSVSVFVPSPAAADPTFEANLAGLYTFRLRVWDAAGHESCEPADVQVAVIPDAAVHVELFWSTPGDVSVTDEGPAAGSDLDLHFAHPYASATGAAGDEVRAPWFDAPYDCYWFNRAPDWGSMDPNVDDDPSLDRDDTDGWGPENLNLHVPQGEPSGPVTYRVGVHCWDDHNFGPSFATVRVYVYSTLVFEIPDVELQKGDLWDAATIEWPSTVSLVQGATGALQITPEYPVPGFVRP